MSSQAQINANRANAQLSTGPKTSGGINKSKFNATRHGLTGKQIVFDGEDPAAYDALRESLIAEHGPASETEAMLVEEVAQNWWRLQRARRFEAQLAGKLPGLDAFTEKSASKNWDRMQRYLRSIERSWANALKELGKLQKARNAEQAESPSPQPRAAATRPVSAEIGFVLQNAADAQDSEDAGPSEAAA